MGSALGWDFRLDWDLHPPPVCGGVFWAVGYIAAWVFCRLCDLIWRS